MFLDSRFPSFCSSNPKYSISSKIVLILVFKSIAPKRSLEWGSECMYITILEYQKYYQSLLLSVNATYDLSRHSEQNSFEVVLFSFTVPKREAYYYHRVV